jgi:hypothetical protein
MKSLVSMKEVLAFFSNCFEDSAQQDFFYINSPNFENKVAELKNKKWHNW